MIIQINAEEWILLQDVLSAGNWKHSEQERHAFQQKLNDAFNEQCKSPSEAPFGLKEKFEATITTR